MCPLKNNKNKHMKKALIITYYWPPAGGAGVQRWLKFVKYFRDYGIEPVVYTVKNPNYPIQDATLRNDIPTDIEVLQQAIWEPNNIGLFKKKKRESAGFLNPNPSFLGKLVQYIRANYFIPDARKFWIKPSVKYLKKYLKTHPIDIVITTGPPHSVHLIGLKLKEDLDCTWMADFRDPWTEIDYFHQLPLTEKSKKKHANLEGSVLTKADAVLVVGKTMHKKYSEYNKHVFTVTNGYDGAVPEATSKLDGKFTLTHVGSMNADRNPKILWKALSDLLLNTPQFKQDFELKLVGKIDQNVLADIAAYKLSKFAKNISYIPYNEVEDLQKKSQVLLLIVNNVPSAGGIITGKVFEYLNAMRPIIAIAPIGGDLDKIIQETQAGIVVDFNDSEALKMALITMYDNYKSGNLQVNSKNIDQYHRKNLTKKVSEIIKEITK